MTAAQRMDTIRKKSNKSASSEKYTKRQRTSLVSTLVDSTQLMKLINLKISQKKLPKLKCGCRWKGKMQINMEMKPPHNCGTMSNDLIYL